MKNKYINVSANSFSVSDINAVLDIHKEKIKNLQNHFTQISSSDKKSCQSKRQFGS